MKYRIVLGAVKVAETFDGYYQAMKYAIDEMGLKSGEFNINVTEEYQIAASVITDLEDSDHGLSEIRLLDNAPVAHEGALVGHVGELGAYYSESGGIFAMMYLDTDIDLDQGYYATAVIKNNKVIAVEIFEGEHEKKERKVIRL